MDAIEMQEALRPKIWAVQAGHDSKCHLFKYDGDNKVVSDCGITMKLKSVRDPQCLIKCKRCNQ